jgi:competence ComEA-like helix-hairpin-helix protein
MFFFTPHERRAIIFIAAVFFCGTCLSILFKCKPPLYQQLNVLDEPPSRSKVDINHATYEELLTVPGLGPSTAARIIYARQEKGPFDSLDELRQVKRFSQKMFDRAAPHLTAGPP